MLALASRKSRDLREVCSLDIFESFVPEGQTTVARRFIVWLAIVRTASQRGFVLMNSWTPACVSIRVTMCAADFVFHDTPSRVLLRSVEEVGNTACNAKQHEIREPQKRNQNANLIWHIAKVVQKNLQERLAEPDSTRRDR